MKINKSRQGYTKKPMSSSPFFENQAGYYQYQEEQGLPPLCCLDSYEKFVPDSEEDSETQDTCKWYDAVTLFKYSLYFYLPMMKMNLFQNKMEVRMRNIMIKY